MPESSHKPTMRVLSILQALADNNQGLTLTEIARTIDSPKSTIFPVLNTMREEGFIYLDSKTSLYALGIKSYCVGAAYINNMNALQFIRSEMRRVVDSCGETCQFGIKDGSEVLYVVIEEPDVPNRFHLASSVGQRLPLYCTALGKVLLVGNGMGALDQLYPGKLKSFTKNTVTNTAKLEHILREVAQNGYAIDDSEVQDDLRCIAAPMYKGDQIVAAVSVSFPIYRASDQKFQIAKQALFDMQENVKCYLEANNVDPASLMFNISTK